ncbi:hypothetical protein JW911_01400 [Candidatus Peregrinibacteria bacterium]|nr:hypothetical protein [Candidatus Peregrinibacteria bacterium]
MTLKAISKPTKSKTKDDLIKLIKSADYLNDIQKKEWLIICEKLDISQHKLLYDAFINAENEEKDFKLKLIFKYNLADTYKSKIKEISAKYQIQSRKKDEAYLSKTEEKPEEILNKLQNI